MEAFYNYLIHLLSGLAMVALGLYLLLPLR